MKKYNYPHKISFFRVMFNSSKLSNSPIPYHKQFFDESKTDAFSIQPFLSKPIILTRDAKHAKYVLQKHHKNYEKSKIQTHVLANYLGYGLLTSTRGYWLKQRRLIQPGFHKEKINNLISIINTSINEQISAISSDTFISLYPIMNTLAFNVVAKSLFNYSAKKETLQRLQVIIETLQNDIVKYIRQPHKRFWYKIKGDFRQSMKLVKESRAIINTIINTRRDTNDTHNDLLDMLINAEYEDGKKMTNEQLIDEILILFVAGHETTASALTFTLFLLANHKTKLQSATAESLDLTNTNSNLLTALSNFKYIKQCIEESMRLYPPAWITDRVALEDDMLGDYRIKKGTLIGISIYEMHRNTSYWTDANQFKPERFSEKHKKKITSCYMPFGAGPRLCIGNNFAMYEMILAINAIINKFKIETNTTKVKFNPLITLKPVDVELKFTLKP